MGRCLALSPVEPINQVGQLPFVAERQSLGVDELELKLLAYVLDRPFLDLQIVRVVYEIRNKAAYEFCQRAG